MHDHLANFDENVDDENLRELAGLVSEVAIVCNVDDIFEKTLKCHFPRKDFKVIHAQGQYVEP